MAWFSKENMQSKRPLISAVLKKYGMKGTLSGTNTSSVTLTLTEGPLNFMENCAHNMENDAHGRPVNAVTPDEMRARKYMDVNPYWYHEHFDGQCLEFLKEVMQVLNDGNHDNSDIMTDYFDVGWYVHVKIGKWDKPYVLRK
jgi:hypothetical protein